MKISFYLLIVFMFVHSNTFAQSGWIEQTSWTEEILRSIFFFDESNGWVVGGGSSHKVGAILNTNNGGEFWNYQQLDSSMLLSIQFTNDTLGWIVGGSLDGNLLGMVHKTTDGGLSWNDVQTNGIHFLPIQVFFVDNDNGWLLAAYDPPPSLWQGPYLQKTTDGGESWFELNNCPLAASKIYFADDSLGWLVTLQPACSNEAGIFKTTDGGETWTEKHHSYAGFLDIYFIDRNRGWAIGGFDEAYQNFFQEIYITEDGGDNWQIQLYDTTAFALRSIYFIDENYGWVCGPYGTILKTTDGGIDWDEQISGTNNHLHSIYFHDNKTGWVAGADGVILHTTNGGVSFVEENEIEEIPTNYSLSNNYPNPFNPSTKIKYTIPQSLKVIIKVYDILGNEIETIINEEKQIGIYEITWYAEGLPSGVYFYQLKAGSFVETKKMILMK